jgi:hypothetical protein
VRFCIIVLTLLELLATSGRAGVDPNAHPPLATPFARGVNVTNWVQAGSPGQIQFTKFTEQDLIDIRSLGCDVIRLPINLHHMTDGPPHYGGRPVRTRPQRPHAWTPRHRERETTGSTSATCTTTAASATRKALWSARSRSPATIWTSSASHPHGYWHDVGHYKNNIEKKWLDGFEVTGIKGVRHLLAI